MQSLQHPEFIPTGSKWFDFVQVIGIYVPNVLATVAAIIAMRRAGRAAQSSKAIERAIDVETIENGKGRTGEIDRRQ